MKKEKKPNAEIIITFNKNDEMIILVKKTARQIFFTPSKSQAYLLGTALWAYGNR